MKNPCRKTNTVFLVMTVVYLLTSLFLSMLSTRSISIPTAVSLILGELIVVIPGLCFLILFRCDLLEWMPFKKVKKSTIAFTALITLTIMPFLYFLNIVSQLFETNVALDLLTKVDEVPGIVVFFIIGIFGPVCEEIAFRGILFSGFKKSGRIFAAIIWSGLLFGLFHMNLNQFGYACAIGIISALLIEATGSIWPSITMHVIINSYNVLQLYISQFVYGLLGTDIEELVSSEEMISKTNLIIMAAFLLIPAAGGIVVSVVIYNAIMKREGRKEYVLSILPHKKKDKAAYEETTEGEKKPQVFSFSGIVGVLICLFVIFAFEIIVKKISGSV